jgi:hypothetical protein
MFTTLRLRQKGLLDSRNISLWKEIRSAHKIKVLKATDGEYSVHSINKNSTLRYVDENICADSFSHELLHIYLRLKGCLIGASLKLHIQCSSELSRIMSYELLEHIGNCLDHVRMLPMYLDLGFDRKKFIQDYHIRKIGEEFTEELRKNYREYGIILAENADVFIGKLFAVLADPNKDFDYSKDLEELRKIDPVLFEINKKLFDSWLETPLGDYHSILIDYYDEMVVWESNNIFRT